MVERPKKQNKTAQPSTTFVMVTPELQVTNALVKEAYDQIIKKASELLTKFEMTKYRTYAIADYTSEKENHHIADFSCHLWSLSLANSRQGKSYINFYYDDEFIKKFGAGLTNQLVRFAYKVTEEISYCFNVSFQNYNVHGFFYKLVVGGETDTVSIHVAERNQTVEIQ